VAALGVHHHGIDRVGIALPLEPRAFGAAGHIRAVAALEHDAFDGLGVVARAC